ncbi:hypothetical protein BLOT_003288 [Blomia tropicalis]|nr:hypothetical protein BLOT_003288 [Blomia tropicalis]
MEDDNKAMFIFKTILFTILGTIVTTSPLLILLFISKLHGILILLIIDQAINSITGALGILIGCHTTIISTAIVQLAFTLLLAFGPKLPIPGQDIFFLLSCSLFILLLVYAIFLKTEKKDDQFMWAPYNRDQP